MKFKVLNARREKNVTLVTGCYVAEDKEETKTLMVLRDALEEVNMSGGGGMLCDRFVSNSNTILFKSVPIDALYSVLVMHVESFEIKLKVVMGRNMHGKKIAAEIEEYFKIHKI